ncbi:MAG TPA: response regulator transcription factor [Bryobacteraceae bacterium]|nr:response regulator transcription factor [Bryobacteraceae bacterium]
MRILIADDHDFVRKGIRSLLERRPEWEVCGEAASGHDAIIHAERLRPDLVLLDISMPDVNGLEALPEILKAHPDTKVAILTVHESAEIVGRALASGAHGVISKSDAARDLVRGVEALARQQRFISPRLVQSAVKRRAASIQAQPRRDSLNSAELELLQLLVEGRSEQDAAEELNIPSRVAHVQRVSLMYKLKLQSASDLFHLSRQG